MEQILYNALQKRVKTMYWNKIILDEFIRLGELTDIEKQVLHTHVAGKSRVQA